MEEPIKMPTRTVANPGIVSQEEWEAARQHLLVKEKALTRGMRWPPNAKRPSGV